MPTERLPANCGSQTCGRGDVGACAGARPLVIGSHYGHGVGGEQQMLAIGQALMSFPKLFLLDEPSLGLAPIVKRTGDILMEGQKREGISIILAEQNANWAFADRRSRGDPRTRSESGRRSCIRADARLQSSARIPRGS